MSNLLEMLLLAPQISPSAYADCTCDAVTWGWLPEVGLKVAGLIAVTRF
jgi:hypothetical protein